MVSIIYSSILATINLQVRHMNLLLYLEKSSYSLHKNWNCVGGFLRKVQKYFKCYLDLPIFSFPMNKPRVMFFHPLHRHAIRFDDFSQCVRIMSPVIISHCGVRCNNFSQSAVIISDYCRCNDFWLYLQVLISFWIRCPEKIPSKGSTSSSRWAKSSTSVSYELRLQYSVNPAYNELGQTSKCTGPTLERTE